MKMTSVFLSGYWDGVKEALPGALGNTVIGILVVFSALLFICFIISIFKFISIIEGKRAPKQEKKEEAKALPGQAIENTVAQIAEAEEELSDDLALAAVITAAIYAYEEANGNAAAVANGLVVRSIRRAKKNGWQNA